MPRLSATMTASSRRAARRSSENQYGRASAHRSRTKALVFDTKADYPSPIDLRHCYLSSHVCEGTERAVGVRSDARHSRTDERQALMTTPSALQPPLLIGGGESLVHPSAFAATPPHRRSGIACAPRLLHGSYDRRKGSFPLLP